jgi:hypothetical protein
MVWPLPLCTGQQKQPRVEARPHLDAGAAPGVAIDSEGTSSLSSTGQPNSSEMARARAPCRPPACSASLRGEERCGRSGLIILIWPSREFLMSCSGFATHPCFRVLEKGLDVNHRAGHPLSPQSHDDMSSDLVVTQQFDQQAHGRWIPHIAQCENQHFPWFSNACILYQGRNLRKKGIVRNDGKSTRDSPSDLGRGLAFEFIKQCTSGCGPGPLHRKSANNILPYAWVLHQR